MTPHEKAIEAGAKAAYDCWMYKPEATWESLHPIIKEGWLRGERAFIAAYLASARESGCNIPKIEGEP